MYQKIKKYNQQILLILCILFVIPSLSQNIKGIVKGIENGEIQSLPGANIYWEGTSKGVASGPEGEFSIKPHSGAHHLIISYIGYKNDTLHIHSGAGFQEIILEKGSQLDEVEITGKQSTNFVSSIKPIHTQVLTTGELQKAACCNLSESFETNASVDVSYSDALTGAKQIRLLGLDGTYVQMMIENIPALRGLSSAYGLGYIPGSWMESIQISKGAASVINGYESITGQINVEYKKPEGDELLHLNTYVNNKGKIEGNVNAKASVNDKISTMVLAHYEYLKAEHDHNNDLFMDMPLIEQYNFMNRWKYKSGNLEGQLGLSFLSESRKAGQLSDIDPENTPNSEAYKISINAENLQAFSKTGYIFPGREETSIGFQNKFTYHDQNAVFGLRKYLAEQKSWYSNLIIHTYVGTLDHKINAGLSFSYDEYNESLNDSLFTTIERIPGSFFEYTFSKKEKLSLLAGIRADYHNTYGSLITPRLHMKIHASPKSTIRLSAGKAYRSPRIIAENNYLLASSRDLFFDGETGMEEAWNFGIHILQHTNILSREASISLDFYRTSFINQIVIDLDRDHSLIHISMLDGKSFSNSLQAELSYEPFDGLDLSIAYRLNDVRLEYESGLKEKPLLSRYKAFFNASYQTAMKTWQFDFTTQLNGKGRLPDRSSYPEEYQNEKEFPAYWILNAQISRFFKNWSIYAGVENLSDFTQEDVVIAASDPFGEYFDASQLWGPVLGRKIYAGLRLTIKNN